MFFKSLKLATALVLGLGAAAAHAATFTYNLSDHGYGSEAANHDYGLRLDAEKRFFSFGNGASAQLIYDDEAGTAKIVGTVRESLGLVDGSKTFGALWDIVYDLSGLMNAGTGQFKDKTGAGTGSVSLDDTVIALGAKANSWGTYFAFLDDGHRIPNTKEGFVGRGWVRDAKCCNDFLFQAELDDGGTGGAVPLPAAGWMLLSGLVGMGAVSRRRRRA